MPKIQLCTRGDDAGCCVAANRAVEQAAKFGILKNLSVMVPGPAFEDAAARLRDIKNVSLGLHVTLNSEWERVRWGPVLSAAKVPALVDSSGYFTPTPKHLNDREPPLEQMVAEVRAQLHKARAAGMRIDYIDEHMGVGWVRGLRQEIIQLADREGLRFKESLPSDRTVAVRRAVATTRSSAGHGAARRLRDGDASDVRRCRCARDVGRGAGQAAISG
jgi:predicted glycoside hydrolase/deacetylase ChbG (UPF0249 family)